MQTITEHTGGAAFASSGDSAVPSSPADVTLKTRVCTCKGDHPHFVSHILTASLLCRPSCQKELFRGEHRMSSAGLEC